MWMNALVYGTFDEKSLFLFLCKVLVESLKED